MRELKKYYRVVPLFNTKYKVEELNPYGRNRNCFLTRRKAEVDFKTAQKIAVSKYEQVLKGLDMLRKKVKVDFYFDYFMEGATYGIYEEGMYIGLTVNGYAFEFLQ